LKFVVEFNFLLKKDIVIEIFKKNATNGREMNFEEFQLSLEKIAERLNEDKIRSNLNKIKIIRAMGNNNNDDINKKKSIKSQNNNNNQNNSSNNNINPLDENQNQNQENTHLLINSHQVDPINLNEKFLENKTELININEDQNNNNNNNNYNSNITDNNNEISSEKNQEEINSIKKIIIELKKKTKAELIADIFDYMEIYDQKNYQKKMKGFINPFSTEKATRIEEGLLKGILKFDSAASENVKKILMERKQQKIEKLEKIEKAEKAEKNEKLKSQENKNKILNLKNNLKNNSIEKNIRTKDKSPLKYADIQRKYNNIIKEKETKLTWDQVENLNYNHFITDRADDFKPNDLLDQDNDSDDENIFDTSADKSTNNYTLKTKESQVNYMYTDASNEFIMNPHSKPNSNLIYIQNGLNIPLPNNNFNNNYNNYNYNNNYNNNYNQQGIYTENNNVIKSNLILNLHTNQNVNNNNFRNNNNLKGHNRKINSIANNNLLNINSNNIIMNNNNNLNHNRYNSLDNSYSKRNYTEDNVNINIQRKIVSPKGDNNIINQKNKNNNNNNNNNSNNNSIINNKNANNSIINNNNNKNNGSKRNNSPRNNNNNSYANIYGNNNGKQLVNIEKTEKLAREADKIMANKSAKVNYKYFYI
jgi:hypothetical protein